MSIVQILVGLEDVPSLLLSLAMVEVVVFKRLGEMGAVADCFGEAEGVSSDALVVASSCLDSLNSGIDDKCMSRGMPSISASKPFAISARFCSARDTANSMDEIFSFKLFKGFCITRELWSGTSTAGVETIRVVESLSLRNMLSLGWEIPWSKTECSLIDLNARYTVRNVSIPFISCIARYLESFTYSFFFDECCALLRFVECFTREWIVRHFLHHACVSKSFAW